LYFLSSNSRYGLKAFACCWFKIVIVHWAFHSFWRCCWYEFGCCNFQFSMLMQFTLKAWCSCSWFLDIFCFSPFLLISLPFFSFFFKFWTKCFYFFLSSTIVNAHDCNTLLHVFVVCPKKLWFLFTNFGLVSIEFMFVFGFHNIALLKVWILVKFVRSLSFYCFLLCLLWTSIVYSSQN
jgi:hypothetical protein